MQDLLAPFEGPVDVAGFVLWALVFPMYHTIYPWLARHVKQTTALERTGRLRRSWIERVIERQDTIVAIQATRNLTMVNTLLASSALIMMGFTANMVLRVQQDPTGIDNPMGYLIKLDLILVTLALAFSFIITALRHLGHFNLTVGADPAILAEEGGSAVDYLTAIIGRASGRYTLGVRAFYGILPLLLWLFQPWLFLGLTVFWAVKFLWLDF